MSVEGLIPTNMVGWISITPEIDHSSKETSSEVTQNQENTYALKVLSLATAMTGPIISVLGLASDHASHIVTPLGVIVLAAGVHIYRRDKVV